MGTWESTLQPRDINNDGTVDAFYDTVLNISWLADANASAGSGFDATYGGGSMGWPEATAWAANLNVHGLNGWRLPKIDEAALGISIWSFGGTDYGFNVRTVSADGRTVYSELAHLYHVTLGNLALCDRNGDCSQGIAISGQSGGLLQNTGNFRNLVTAWYWSGLSDPIGPWGGSAWQFGFDTGFQAEVSLYETFVFAIAVRPGDLTTAASVPEPQTAGLALAALGAMLAAGWRRRSKKTSTP